VVMPAGRSAHGSPNLKKRSLYLQYLDKIVIKWYITRVF
jgi:hypothetical protein